MNFFAHAFVAARHNPDAAFVLGAMLPDLCGFARARSRTPPRGALGEGVRFHHTSDAAFHAHPAFATRCTQLSRALEAGGVRRGPARGAAHVASELLLDGWLARAGGVPRVYRDALASARELLRGASVDAGACAAIAVVCDRIGASPLPEAYGDASFVCERVERALAQRAFLALAPRERPALAQAVAREAPLCASWAPGVLESFASAVLRPSSLRAEPVRALRPLEDPA